MTKENKTEIGFWKTLVFIGGWYKKFPFWAVVAVVGRVISVILGLLPAIYYSDMITLLSQVGVKSELAQQGIAILCVIIGIRLTNNALIYRIYDYATISLEMQIQEYLYNRLFTYIHGHSVGYFAENFAGALITKIRKCIGAMERFTDMIMWNIIPFFLNLIVILVVVGQTNWLISLGILIFVVVFSLIQYKMTKWIQPYQDRANTLDTELGAVLSDTITNALTLKTFAALSRESEHFAKANKEAMQARKTQYFKSMWQWGTSFILVVFLELGVMRYALELWGKGAIELGIITLVQSYVFRLIEQIMGVGQIFRAFSRTVSEIGESLEILQTPWAVQDVQNANTLEVKEAKICFHEVGFAYGEENVFQDLSFDIKAGEHIALVGASGSGKSTITKLLFRFYDIHSGKILIDDQDISTVSQESLRRQISLVPQDPVLFHRSIKENIAYAKPDATDEEIFLAAKMAKCDLFIEHLEGGYDALVGERGVKLSGGERQRIAIARAILENAPILIMDEATSALDSESEKYIQEAMQEVMKNKTTIVIAHRLSTIMQMDRIIVMDQGKIAEIGSHTELLANTEGIYYKLRNIQSGGFIGDGDKE